MNDANFWKCGAAIIVTHLSARRNLATPLVSCYVIKEITELWVVAITFDCTRFRLLFVIGLALLG